MQQQTNDIENKFLQIENEAEADLSQIDNHWAQMKNTLAMQTPKMATPKKWLWVSLPIITIIGLLLFFVNRNPNNIAKVNDVNKLGYDAKTEIMDSTSFQKNNDTSSQNKITIFETKKQTNNSLTSTKSTISNRVDKPATINKSKNLNNTKGIKDSNANTTTNTNIVADVITDSTIVDNNVSNARNIEMLNNFISKIQKKGELFTINNLRDTTIKAAEGTVFYIPMNSFNTTDSVVFEVKEYYKYSDMVANGLTTMSDGKQLISGGMLSLNATVKGKEVAMNPTKEIRVYIPNLTAKDSMKIFEGIKKTNEDRDFTNKNFLYKDNNVNWQLTDRNLYSPISKKYFRALDLREDIVKERKTIFTKKRIGVFFKSPDSEISKEALIVMLKKKYGTYYDIIKVRKLWKRNLLLQNNDLFGDWMLGKDERGIGDTIEFEPKNVGYFNFDIIDTIYRTFNWTYGNFTGSFMSKFSQKELKMIDDKYSICINKLGWINCDRFYDYSGEKQDIYVNINDNAKNYVTYLIFENYKSIMNGYWANKEFKFPNVPLGIPAKVLSIGVKDGQTVFAMKDIITSKNIVSDLQFEQASSVEFKETLKTLDKPLN